MLKKAESVVSAMIDTMAKDWAMKIMKKDPLDAFIKGGQMVHDKIIEALNYLDHEKKNEFSDTTILVSEHSEGINLKENILNEFKNKRYF